MKNRTNNCLRNYNTGSTVGLAVQMVVKTLTQLCRKPCLETLETAVSPFILFDKDKDMFWVVPEMKDG